MKDFLDGLLVLVIGMGTVFATLIILMGVMELLGRLFKDKVPPEPPLEPESASLPLPQDTPSTSSSSSEATARVEAPAAVPGGVVSAPPQPSVSVPEALAIPKAAKPQASLDKKRRAAIAGVMAFLQEEAAALSRKAALPRVSPDVIGIVSAWRIAGMQILIGSRGRPLGR